MQELKPIKEGKVREIYDNGDSLIMVATDRISCFDVILDNVISKKGTVLTQMSKFWFDMTQASPQAPVTFHLHGDLRTTDVCSLQIPYRQIQTFP